MKKLFLSLLVVLCISDVSWSQNKEHGRMLPQRPQQRAQMPQQHATPRYHYQPNHYQYYRQPIIYYYPFYYNYYPYYYRSYPSYYPYYQKEPVDNELALRVRQGYVRNPITNKLEWRYPGYWKQNEDGIWMYKRTTEWPLPGHWTEKREWLREDAF